MAGAGYKLFNTGDVLLASEVNTYLMQQTVMVFANATARTSALSGVLAEGMVSYLQDTNVVEIYNGSAWASLDDPNAIQNTIVDAKGDLISATADNTPARLASSGNNGEVLTIDTSTSTGLKWAAPSSSSGPAFSVFRSGSTQSLTQSVTTKIEFNGETFDTDNCFDSTTNYRFTPNKAGYYQINYFISVRDYGTGADTYVWLYKNGTLYVGSSPWTGGGDVSRLGSVLVYMNGTTDYLECFVNAGGNSTKYVYDGNEETQFSGVWIRS